MPYESNRRNNKSNSSGNLGNQTNNGDLFSQGGRSSSTNPYSSIKGNPLNQKNSSNTDSASAPTDKKQQEKEATKNAAKTAAKGAATYVAGGAGGKAVDVLANTKAGQQVLNNGAELLNKIPGVGKTAKKLDDSGTIKKADKALDIAGGGKVNQPMPSGNNKMSGDSKGATGSPSESGGGGSFGPKPPFGPKSPFGKSKDRDSEDGQADSDYNGMGFGHIPVGVKIAIAAIISMGGLLFLLVILFFNMTSNIKDFDDALGASIAAGDETGNIDYEATSKEAQKFYDRVNDVKLSFQAKGKTVDYLKIVAVYHILNENDSSITYDDMTTSAIEEIADSMFDNNSYSEDVFRENLINDIFPKYLSDMTDTGYEKLADDVFDYIDRYNTFIGKESSSTTCASLGSCVYDIKGFSFDGRNVSKAMNIKDLKVRLMQCGPPYGPGNYSTPIDGEDLVNFEDYIAGVAYGEIGPDAPLEAMKAQMIAARSYALARPTAMGNALGKKLEEENGQWILQISSCVADQVFCNIDKGCSHSGGGQQGGYLKSGVNFPGLSVYKGPLPEEHNIRVAAAETQGEVLLNSQGYVIQTGFLATESNMFTSMANSGLNYKQILLQVYNQGSRAYGADSISESNCNDGNNSGCSSSDDDSSGGTGNVVKARGAYANWKQFGAPWSNVMVGASGQNIGAIGCLATSVAILIAKSRENTVIKDFNPGTFVSYLNSHGGFIGGGLFVWSSATTVAPTFHYQGQVSVAGLNQADKLNKIKSLVNQGYYVTAEVKGSTGQHWVAIDSVSGNNIIMMDPGSNSTNMWSQYNWQNTSTLGYYKVSK